MTNKSTQQFQITCLSSPCLNCANFIYTWGIIAFGRLWFSVGRTLLYPIQSASAMLLQPNVKDVIDSDLVPITSPCSLSGPWPKWRCFWCFALYLFPMFSILIAADQFSSDKTRGTLRFLTIRTSRDSLLFGRFLGQILIQGLLILIDDYRHSRPRAQPWQPAFCRR